MTRVRSGRAATPFPARCAVKCRRRLFLQRHRFEQRRTHQPGRLELRARRPGVRRLCPAARARSPERGPAGLRPGRDRGRERALGGEHARLRAAAGKLGMAGGETPRRRPHRRLVRVRPAAERAAGCGGDVGPRGAIGRAGLVLRPGGGAASGATSRCRVRPPSRSPPAAGTTRSCSPPDSGSRSSASSSPSSSIGGRPSPADGASSRWCSGSSGCSPSTSSCSPMRCSSGGSTRTSGRRGASSMRSRSRSSRSRPRATPPGRSTSHLSRGVVLHSTALLVSGIYLLAMAAAGYYVRFFGGSWGRMLQVAFVFAALLVLALVVLSGQFRSRLRVFVSKHFFSYRFDYREEWLRFTQTLSTAEPAPRAAGAVHQGAGGSRGELGRRALAARTRTSSGRSRAGTCPRSAMPSPGDGALAAFLERNGWVVDLRQCAASPERYQGLVLPGVARVGARGLADRAARQRERVHRLRRARAAARGDAGRLGGARSAQDRGPAGRELPRPDPRDRAAARGAQVRRVQPHVGVRGPRPEEPGRAALAPAAERRAPPRQPRVPAGRAGDGRARGAADERDHAAAADRDHAGGRPEAGRARAAGAQDPGREGRPAARDRGGRRRGDPRPRP